MIDEELPEGFTPHDGGSAPEGVDEKTRVICAIRTVHGIRLSAEAPAYMHIWEENLHDDGIGAVVGFKLATP
jgi:hypothetical protein